MVHETQRKFCRIGSPASAGRELATPWRPLSSGRTGGKVLPEFCRALVAGIPAQGQTWLTSNTCSRPTVPVIREGKEIIGETAGARATGGGILDRRVDIEADRGNDPDRIRRSLPSWACMEGVAERNGVELPEAGATRVRTKRRGHRALETLRMAGYKKTLANLVPIWPFWMKAASCLSRMSARRGHPKGRHRTFITGTGTTESRPFRRSPSRRDAIGSDCIFTFTLPTLPPMRWLLSCMPCFDTCADTFSCCGTAARFIGDSPSKSSFARILVSTPFAFRLMLRNLTLTSSSGRKPNMISPTALQKTSMISTLVWIKASDGSAALKLFWPPVLPLQS